MAVPDYASAIERPVQGLRGCQRTISARALSPEVKGKIEAGIALLEKLGCKRVSTENAAHLPYAIATYYIVATAEASSNLARTMASATGCAFRVRP